MRSLLLSGPGLHTVVSFGEKPLEGDYRILIDAKQAVATSRVVVAYIPITDLFMKSLRAFPGVKITDTVQAPARSTGTELSLMLQAGTESAFIDVAVTDPRVKVNLRYPDGTIVNRENATAHRVTWDLSPWPPKSASGDLFGFGAAMQASMMLPVEGVHHLIYFARGVGATGSYAIQVNASGSDRASEVSAMFLPAESAARQVEKAFSEIGNPPLEPGETRVVSYAVESDQSYFALDKIDVKIGFRGAPLREPVQFSSRATVTAGSDQQTKPIDVPIAFARGADGLYHGVFIPPAGGVYQITTDIRGTQASGQPFSGESSPGVIPVLPLVAKMDRLAGRAVDTDGKGRPDRLEVTAHVDVEEAGEYRLAVNLSDDGGKILYGMAKAILWSFYIFPLECFRFL